jgi:RNA polymerase sigma factor (sigma-70 family)
MKIISLEDNLEYVEYNRSYDPTDDMNSSIDREMALNRFTDRERRILELLEMGYTQEEIAEKMGVSHSTVKRAIRKIRENNDPFLDDV